MSSHHDYIIEITAQHDALKPFGARRHQAEPSGRRLDSATGIHGDAESSR